MNKIDIPSDGFVSLIDHMGSDSSICNAARVSYGNHKTNNEKIQEIRGEEMYQSGNGDIPDEMCLELYNDRQKYKDRNLIRYLMRHRHTTPFEMVSFIFLVRAPIHVARQWFRHRTWSYNEYSTRYKEAIDSFETTPPDQWRTQANNNKQGSGEYLTGNVGDKFNETDLVELPLIGKFELAHKSSEKLGNVLSQEESELQRHLRRHYDTLLEAGVAREQARKDLPLSTYTEFYAKVDLHNLFHFISLRSDSHAQLEIRRYSDAIYEIIKPIVPISCEAFEDYRLNGSFFSVQELEILKNSLKYENIEGNDLTKKTSNLSDREWKEFLDKLE